MYVHVLYIALFKELTDISSEFPNYTFSSLILDLGVVVDQELAPHLNRVACDCFYQLQQLHTVARSLSTGAAAILVHSFVTNCLDYCLSLYSGLPYVRLAYLDHIQRSAACLIGQIPKFGHVTGYVKRFCTGSLSDSA